MLTYKYYFLYKILPFIKMHYRFSRGLELIDLPGYFKEIELITLIFLSLLHGNRYLHTVYILGKLFLS